MPLSKPSKGLQLNIAHPLSRGLIFCPLFNELTGGIVQDVGGNKAIGSLSGNAAWSAGIFGSGLRFDGTADYVSFAAKDWMVPDKVTVLAWVNPTAIEEVNHFVLSKGSSYLLDAMRALAGWDYPHFYVSGSRATSSEKLVAGCWNQLVGTYDGAVIRIYVDGRQTGSTNYTGGIPASSENLYVAVDKWTAGGFDGYISHVMVWKRALSGEEIAYLFREPFCMFQPKVNPAVLFAPAGQIVSLAGTCSAGTNVTGSLKVAYRLARTVSAHASVSGSLTVVGQTPPAEQWFTGALNIEQDWLLAALFGGMTANAVKLGTALVLGWFWMRRSGCSVLYRGPTMDGIDLANALAVAEQNAAEISPPGYLPHSSSSTYFYVVRRFNNCGYEERTFAAAVEVSTDTQGSLKPPQPNRILSLSAGQIDSDKVQLVWFYCPLAQGSHPQRFRVYYDGGTGQIDYQNPIATIAYQGQKSYCYKTVAFGPGRYFFAVRAEDEAAVQDDSPAVLSIQLAGKILDAVDILSAERV